MKTAIQEKQEKLKKLRENPNFTHIYDPIMWDMIDGRVIKGCEIETVEKICIIGKVGDPLNKFIYVLDSKGNEMSIYKQSAVKI